MKKFVNDPGNVITEELEGLAALYPRILRTIEGTGITVRIDSPARDKVALVSGGGSGHEPLHSGYVGKGMLDAAVSGAVFSAPPPDQILRAVSSVNGGKGVLLIIKNYSGDIMNFRIAEELATASGIEVSHVIVNDDIAIKEPENRRGVAGTVLVHKIAGARAETGATLDDVRKIADRVISNVRTMGVALSSCINPSVGRPIFSIGENQIEIGIGIHGEVGVERMEIANADAIAEILYRRVSNDLGLKEGEEVFLLVNGMGGTPLMELLIISRKVREILNLDGIRVFRATAGNYATSLEMAGFSLSLLRVDEEMKQMILAPQSTPAFPTIV